MAALMLNLHTKLAMSNSIAGKAISKGGVGKAQKLVDGHSI